MANSFLVNPLCEEFQLPKGLIAVFVFQLQKRHELYFVWR